MEMTSNTLLKNWSTKASRYHARVPYLSRLPFPALAIIITLIIVNLLVWAAVGIVLVCNPHNPQNLRFVEILMMP